MNAPRLPEHLPWLQQASADELRRCIEALYRVNRLSAAVTDLNTLLVRLAEESRLVARAEAASLMLYDASSDELYFQIALGEEGDQEALKREVRLKLDQGIAGVTAQSREATIVENAQEDPRFFRQADETSHFRTRNLLAVPMIDRDELVGVLEVVNKVSDEAFTSLDLHVMEMFASTAALAIVNARLIEEHIKNERVAAIGLAVAGLSHYTKNLVTGLNSSIELMGMGMDRGEWDMVRRTWPVFKRSTKRISNFVQDMLSYSKDRKPYRRACDLNEIVQDARETFEELFVSKGVEVEVDTSGCDHAVQLDPDGIYRCLLNLFTNAADAVPENTGRIRVEAGMRDGTLELIVADNGPGIPEPERVKLFDPFYSTKGANGTGLGLAVTNKIIEEHGGNVEVAEAPEGGALFRLIIPDAVAPPKEPELFS